MLQAIGSGVLALVFLGLFLSTLGMEGSLVYPLSYPQWLLAAIAVFLGVAVFIKAPAADPHHEERHGEPGEAGGRWALWGTIVLCILYVMAWEWIGFLLSTLLYVGLQLVLLKQRSIPVVLGEAAAVTIVVYVVFQRLLLLPLPAGQLFGG